MSDRFTAAERAELDRQTAGLNRAVNRAFFGAPAPKPKPRRSRTQPPTRWVVVIIAADGSPSVAGPFRDEYRATLWANRHENEETGWTCHVTELDSPAKAHAESVQQ